MKKIISVQITLKDFYKMIIKKHKEGKKILININKK